MFGFRGKYYRANTRDTTTDGAGWMLTADSGRGMITMRISQVKYEKPSSYLGGGVGEGSINLIYRNKVLSAGKPCRSLRFRNASSVVVVREGGHGNFSRWPRSSLGIFLNPVDLSERIKSRVYDRKST